jgi:hypothetical protein
MKVIINLISYEQPEFEVQTTTTISELKKAFQDEIGIPVQNFSLKYKGKTLEDEKTLADYNIPDKGILDIEGNLISTLQPRYVNVDKDGPTSSGMTYEAGRDIKTMLDLLQQHTHLGAPNGSATPSPGFVARTRAYWGDLEQLRSDIKELKEDLATVEKERDDALARAYKAAVERDEALAQLSQLKADVAREKAIKEARERAVVEAAAAAKAKAEEQRRKETEETYKRRLLVEEEKAARKAREEAEKSETFEERKERRERERAQWLKDHENETNEERRAREYRNDPRWSRFGQ